MKLWLTTVQRNLTAAIETLGPRGTWIFGNTKKVLEMLY